MKYPVFKDLIVFENDDFIVVNKPPFLATLEDRALNATNLLKLAKQYHEDAQVCHRLDKETSGALAIAKNPEAYRHLSMQFENREVDKLYHAVVWGVHKFEDLEVDRAIQPGLKGKAKLAYKGKPAQTIFNTVETYNRHSLIACKPITGRMHQIRLHLMYLKAPIVNDELYGGEVLFLSSLKRKFNLKQETEEHRLTKGFGLILPQLALPLRTVGKGAEDGLAEKDFQYLENW